MSIETTSTGTVVEHGERARAAALIAGCLGVIFVVGLSNPLHLGPRQHGVALFVHLASVIVGLGAIVVADYLILGWMSGRIAFAEVVRMTAKLHPLVWLGLAGLVVTGVILEPNIAAGPTQLKLALVVVLTLNGVQAMALARRTATVTSPGLGLILRGAATTAVSQLCWWGAVTIGLWTAESQH